MSFGVRSLSYNAVPQFQKRKRDETLFGKMPFRKTPEEEALEAEEAAKKSKEGAGFRHLPSAKMPNLHIIA